MENCSIPNSTPAIGRTSTPLFRRSREQNSRASSFFEAFGLAHATRFWTLRFFNVQRSTLNAQRLIETVRGWRLGVGCLAFSSLRRVRGAWWSSRSSKPLSVPHIRGRGRFDSYPLRQIFVAASLRRGAHSSNARRDSAVATAILRKEVTRHVA